MKPSSEPDQEETLALWNEFQKVSTGHSGWAIIAATLGFLREMTDTCADADGRRSICKFLRITADDIEATLNPTN